MATSRPGALVTGASAGIGLELARILAREGHDLVLVARRESTLKELAGELKDRYGAASTVVAADLAEAGAGERIEQAIGDATIDVLVNNAGFGGVGAFTHREHDADMRMVAVNVAALTDLTKRFLPGMVARGRGRVLNVASTAAFQPLPGQAAYGAGKAFVLSYTQSLVGELRGTGVSATALCPGPVHTGFGETAGFGKEDAEAALPKMMWVSAAAVAKAAVDGLDRGRLVVIPGAANRVAATFAQITPRSLLVPLLAKNHPGLKH
jgi:uncharacterized protein